MPIAGLAGQGEWEQAKVDEFADFKEDVFNEVRITYVRAKLFSSVYPGIPAAVGLIFSTG